MSGDEHARVTHRVPEHVRNAAQNQSEHGELSELVRSLYQRVAFGEEVEQHESVKMELERVRNEKDQKRSQAREIRAEIEDLETRESRLEEKLSKHTSREQKYEGHLEALETQLFDGAHIDPSHPGVRRAADVSGDDPEKVIEDLKDRNPQVPDYAFESLDDAKYRWDGLDGGGG